LTSGRPNEASSAATIRSQASAISQPPARAGPSTAAPLVRYLLPGEERLQVHAGAEEPSGARDDADDEVGPLVEFVDRLRGRVRYRPVDRIACLGTVDGDDRGTVAVLDENDVVHGELLRCLTKQNQ